MLIVFVYPIESLQENRQTDGRRDGQTDRQAARQPDRQGSDREQTDSFAKASGSFGAVYLDPTICLEPVCLDPGCLDPVWTLPVWTLFVWTVSSLQRDYSYRICLRHMNRLYNV